MTRKRALQGILGIIKGESMIQELSSEERDELIAKIEGIIKDIPFTNWTEATIFDSIDQWIEDNGRIPTASDFKKRGLPPHPVIKLRFGITLKEFLCKHYSQGRLCNSVSYGMKTPEQWLEYFASEYERIKPVGAMEYNSLREKDSPTWATIARINGVQRWDRLLALIGIINGIKRCSATIRSKPSFNIIVRCPEIESIEDYIATTQLPRRSSLADSNSGLLRTAHE